LWWKRWGVQPSSFPRKKQNQMKKIGWWEWMTGSKQAETWRWFHEDPKLGENWQHDDSLFVLVGDIHRHCLTWEMHLTVHTWEVVEWSVSWHSNTLLAMMCWFHFIFHCITHTIIIGKYFIIYIYICIQCDNEHSPQLVVMFCWSRLILSCLVLSCLCFVCVCLCMCVYACVCMCMCVVCMCVCVRELLVCFFCLHMYMVICYCSSSCILVLI